MDIEPRIGIIKLHLGGRLCIEIIPRSRGRGG
jgi:hypothetical protein